MASALVWLAIATTEYESPVNPAALPSPARVGPIYAVEALASTGGTLFTGWDSETVDTGPWRVDVSDGFYWEQALASLVSKDKSVGYISLSLVPSPPARIIAFTWREPSEYGPDPWKLTWQSWAGASSGSRPR